MIGSRAMGIIFPNMHDANIPELITNRTMASVPFAGRYRMIDFCLSGMANARMTNIGVIVRKNYQSLMDHLGNGREWDLSRKRGGLVIFPPYGNDMGELYHGRVEALAMALGYLQHSRESLVVMSDCDIACNIDYKELVESHLASGADITAVYEKVPIKEGMQKDNVTFSINDDGYVTELRNNDYRKGVQNLSMNIYVIGREFLIALIKDAMVRGETHFERQVLPRNLKVMKIKAYECDCFRSRIYDMRSYYDESLRLLDHTNIEKLFPEERPIYTKVRDEAPVRYAIGSKVSDSLVADGCIIEGTVEECVIFRGVRIGKDAHLRNCVIMQGSEIKNGAVMENVVTDKDVVIGEGQNIRGSRSFPVFINKGSRVE